MAGRLGLDNTSVKATIIALHPDAELSKLMDATSEEDIKQYLANLDLSPLSQRQTLSIVSKSNGFINLGLLFV